MTFNWMKSATGSAIAFGTATATAIATAMSCNNKRKKNDGIERRNEITLSNNCTI